MTVEVRIKPVEDLTPVEYHACLRANYGPDNGIMNAVCREYRHHKRGSVAILLWDGPDTTIKSLVGWALMTPAKDESYYISISPHGKKVSKYTAQFWVKHKHRGRGYGDFLLREVNKIDPKPHVIPHSGPSGALFAKGNVHANKDDRANWVPRKKKSKV